MEWIKCSERMPNITGWYDVKTLYGESEASISRTASGKLVWVVPDKSIITHWREKSIN